MKAKRYAVFLVGLFISSLAVSVITRADLGTSPISAIPYVLSLAFSFTLGQFTIAFSLVLILLQILMLRKRFRPEHLLQIPISAAFGYFIDLTMIFVAHIPMPSYPVKVGFLLAGCALLAVGVYLEMIADVAMLPGESFVRAVTQVFHTDFGLTKVCFDVGMTVTAGILSVVLISVLSGVREGTVVATVVVGLIARVFKHLFAPLEQTLFPSAAAQRVS